MNTPTLVAEKPGGRLKVGRGVGELLDDPTADDGGVGGVGEELAEASGSTMTGSCEALGVGAADAAGEAEAGWDATLLGVLVLVLLALGEDVAVDDVVPVPPEGVGEPVEEPVAGGAGGR